MSKMNLNHLLDAAGIPLAVDSNEKDIYTVAGLLAGVNDARGMADVDVMRIGEVADSEDGVSNVLVRKLKNAQSETARLEGGDGSVYDWFLDDAVEALHQADPGFDEMAFVAGWLRGVLAYGDASAMTPKVAA